MHVAFEQTARNFQRVPNEANYQCALAQPAEPKRIESVKGVFTTIPIVDIGAFFGHDTHVQQRVAADLRKGASEVGFLYITARQFKFEKFDAMLARTFNYQIERLQREGNFPPQNSQAAYPFGPEVKFAGPAV